MVDVITWYGSKYGSGTSRNIYVNGQPYGTAQVPESYRGRDEEYFQSAFPQFKTQSQVTVMELAAANLAAQQAKDADAARAAAHNAEQEYLRDRMMGAAVTGEIRSATTPGIVVGVEAMKSAEINKATATTSAEALAIQAMLKSPTAQFAPGATQKGYDISAPYGGIKPTDVKAVEITPEVVGIESKQYDTINPIVTPERKPLYALDASFNLPRTLSGNNTGVSLPNYPAQAGSIAEKYKAQKQQEQEYLTYKPTTYLMGVSESAQQKFESSIGYGNTANPLTKIVAGVGSVVTGLPAFVGQTAFAGEAIIREPVKSIKGIPTGLGIMATGINQQAQQDPYKLGGSVLGMVALSKVGSVKNIKSPYKIGIGNPKGVIIDVGEMPVGKGLAPTSDIFTTGGTASSTRYASTPLKLNPAKSPMLPPASEEFNFRTGGQQTQSLIIPDNTMSTALITRTALQTNYQSSTDTNQKALDNLNVFVGKEKTKTEFITERKMTGTPKDTTSDITTTHQVESKVADTYVQVPKNNIPDVMSNMKGEIEYVSTPQGSFMKIKPTGEANAIEYTSGVLNDSRISGTKQYPQIGDSNIPLGASKKSSWPNIRIERNLDISPAKLTTSNTPSRLALPERTYDIDITTQKGKNTPFDSASYRDAPTSYGGETTGKNIYETGILVKGVPERPMLTSRQATDIEVGLNVAMKNAKASPTITSEIIGTNEYSIGAPIRKSTFDIAPSDSPIPKSQVKLQMQVEPTVQLKPQVATKPITKPTIQVASMESSIILDLQNSLGIQNSNRYDITSPNIGYQRQQFKSTDTPQPLRQPITSNPQTTVSKLQYAEPLPNNHIIPGLSSHGISNSPINIPNKSTPIYYQKYNPDTLGIYNPNKISSINPNPINSPISIKSPDNILSYTPSLSTKPITDGFNNPSPNPYAIPKNNPSNRPLPTPFPENKPRESPATQSNPLKSPPSSQLGTAFHNPKKKVLLDAPTEQPNPIVKKSKSKSKKKAPESQVNPWYPASYENVTWEEMGMMGNRATHIKPKPETQKLFTRLQKTGVSLPTAKQFKTKKLK